KQLFDGFSLSGIFTATSGRAFNANVGGDINNDGNPRNDRSPFVGRNTLRSPNFYQVDMRFSKFIKPSETTKIQFIAEAFNLFNRTNIATINTNQFLINTAVPGQIRLQPNPAFLSPVTSSGNARGANRQFQLALQFEF
ncbi:MAG: hypothetical protein JNN15_20830, partial [Blastocatellia bacterium]|nr:hypothetical protein [Blastocatellia bacterium]